MGQEVPQSTANIHLCFLISWLSATKSLKGWAVDKLSAIEGYSSESIQWLEKKGYVKRDSRGRGITSHTGPRRSRTYTQEEKDRAIKGLSRGKNLKPSTARFYRSILSEPTQRDVFRINLNCLTYVFESMYGIPNRVTATEFAQTHSLPSAQVKAWFRDLIEADRAEIIVIRGKRVLIPETFDW